MESQNLAPFSVSRWSSEYHYTINPEAQKEIRENVERVRERIADAARRSGRTAADVSLVAVSKYAGRDDGVVAGFLNAGIFDLGENRPQKLLDKVDWSRRQNGKEYGVDFVPVRDRAAADRRLRWHFIGTLQRNKARRVLPVVSLIHSIDSLKLLEAVDRILNEENVRQEAVKIADGVATTFEGQERFPATVSALLEVHISDDATKQGFSPDEILDVLPKTTAFKRVKIRGLMGMAGLTATPDETRRQFAVLRTLRDRCRERYPEFTDFNELSMGMSGDFETAIEEGATIVRVGSALYPKR